MNKGLVLKLMALGFMALILLIALGQIEGKVRERRDTRDAAISGIARQYAEAQQVAGPMLWLSCTEERVVTHLDENRQVRTQTESRDCSRLVRPTRLAGNGGLNVGELARGIYKARTYQASLRLTAHFNPVDLQLEKHQKFNGAYWIFGVSDPRGLKRIDVRDANGEAMQAVPGVAGAPLPGGFHIAVDVDALGEEQRLVADIELRGSGRIDWVPVAGENEFSLTSAWPHPSFGGRYLPDTRDVAESGFKAHWRVNAFATGNANVLEQFSKPATEHEYSAENNQRSGFVHAFGVSLIDPVDAYVQSDRAVRYGFLFVLLTLGGFYLFELLKQKTLHPLQYLMIGFAVVVFFLLLLALSEHVGFALAYAAAAAACTRCNT